jgi:carbonic anhydrase
MTQVPPHKPRFAVLKCSDGRLQLVLQNVFRDKAPGHFFKITNAGPLVPPYAFHRLVQHPLEWVSGKMLKTVSRARMRLLKSRFGKSEAAQQRIENFLYKAHYALGWLAITGTFGALRYAIVQKGVRNVIIVVHEACGAHEENLGPQGKDLWNRTIKRNALDNMRKLNRMPESQAVESWHLWYVNFTKRGIQGFDHETQTWKILTLTDVERIMGAKLPAADVSQLFDEIWADPVKDGHHDHVEHTDHVEHIDHIGHIKHVE